MTYKCKVCEGSLFPSPLLQYDGSPKSAQGFLNDLTTKDEVINLVIYQCTKCGLVQHNLEPVSYYKEVIRAVAFSAEMEIFRLEQFGSWISRNKLQTKKILEVGCGKGEYINLLQKSGGEQVFGLEYSESNIASAQKSGFMVLKGYLDASFKPSLDFQFDAFAIFSFLEHWPNPNEGLSILHSHLNDGASGLIEVPNFELILSKGLYSEFTTDHIFYFDKKSLSLLLENNGFEVISIESVWHEYILSAEVRKRKSLDVSNFIKIQYNVKSQLNDYINYFELKEVAIWGAGHQALAVIAMAEIAPRVKYVVDSAPFKQGKYTPASLLLIFPPEQMLRDTPKAVVIMGAGYSDEIAKIIFEKFKMIKNIAILREDRLEIIK